MSTMLATTNPEAVAEIEGNRDRRVPYEGQSLIFHMRPGEGRAGKMRAAAICTRVEDEDHVELLVIFAADDFITRWKIPRKTDQNPVNAWSFNDYDQEHYLRGGPKDAPAINAPAGVDLYKEVGELRARVAELEARKHPKPRAVASE